VVKKVDSISDLTVIPPARREQAREQLVLANVVAPAVVKAAKEQPAFVPFPVQEAGRKYQAVTLPGADAKALAPCRLSEVDMVVPIEGGGEISLTRHFNSFFRPKDVWGGTWTMAHPRMGEAKIPVERTDFGVRYKPVSELSYPLGGASIRFAEVRNVPALNASLHVPDRPCEFLAVAAANDPLIKDAETKVILKDGSALLFNKAGYLVAEQSRPLTTVYLRDTNGIIRQIAGYLTGKIAATITLDYDSQGRLKSATGKNRKGQQSISYQYGADGLTESVTSEEGKTRYAHENGLVKEVSWSAKEGKAFAAPKVVRHFDYSASGQLVAETDGAGQRTTYRIERIGETSRISTIVEGQATLSSAATYDAGFRPLELANPDRSTTKWEYKNDGGVVVRTEFHDGDWVKMTTSGDGRQRIHEGSDAVKIQEEFDGSERLTRVSANGKPILSQQWRPFGLLRATDYESSSIRPEYDATGAMTGLYFTLPEAGDRFTTWQGTSFDSAGRVVAVKDHTGRDEAVSYDDAGNLRQLVTKRDGREFGMTIQRNKDGDRIESVQSSWGNRKYRYDRNGNLERVELNKDREDSALEFVDGQLKEVRQFDGGKVRLDYDNAGNGAKRLKSIATPAITLGYQYASDGSIRHIQCGTRCRFNYDFDQQGRIRRLSMTP